MIKPSFRMTCALSCLVLATACTDPAQFDGAQDPNAKTKTGAAVGALVGAMAGIVTAGDDKLESAAVGAAVGAGAGALIGRSLDKQEAELRNSLGSDVKIRNTGQELIVTMPQDILFESGSAALSGGLRNDLVSLANSLRNYPDTTVDVIGHTDNTGTAEFNQGLSNRRANAVSGVLQDNQVAPSRLRAIGRGEEAPIATNLTEEGKRLNRRVDIVIRPAA